jgi:uncharacterized protein YegP (UPF0339 family)
MNGEAGGGTGGAGAAGSRCQIDIGENGWFSWRLTANNGRVIALGATTYPDDTACRAAFEALYEQPEGLAGGVQHAAESNGWIWRLRDAGGQVLAVSSRAYERHSTCQAAYERFRVLLLDLRETQTVPWGDAD